MSKLRLNMTMSLDGFVAGPNQSEKDPLGIGGMQLHQWMLRLKAFREKHGEEEGGEVNESTPIAEEILGNVCATIMGRNMFGGGPGPWATILGRATGAAIRRTTTRSSSSRAIRASRSRWRAGRRSTSSPTGSSLRSSRPGLRPVTRTSRSGVARTSTAVSRGRPARRDGDLVVPVLLGSGARLFDNLGDAQPTLEQVQAIEAPGVTHIRYVAAQRPS